MRSWLSKRTTELINFAYHMLRDRHPMGLRQLFYLIFSAGQIPFENTTADYKRLSRATTKARRNYRQAELAKVDLESANWGIPPDWMVDETREGEMISVWQDSGAFIETVRHSYRRDLWQDQPGYCEIWSEKGTVLGSLRPVTQELGVMLRVCHGFGSASMECQIGKLFEGIEKPVTIFYAGDFDPSGECIEEDISRRTIAASGRTFEVRRLGIYRSDIARFRLPPKKIKDTDSRAPAFRRKYGKDQATVELDALPVEELRRRVRFAVEGLIDSERWNRQAGLQDVELKSMADFFRSYQTLPPANL